MFSAIKIFRFQKLVSTKNEAEKKANVKNLYLFSESANKLVISVELSYNPIRITTGVNPNYLICYS